MKPYQCIEANNATELEERIAKCIALGYQPIGGVNAKVIQHNIKGATTILRQSMWLIGDSASSNNITTQINLLKQVAETSIHPDGAPEEAVIDTELLEAIAEYLESVIL
ncbi:MAG: hypothetical protein HOC79_05735 [Euryarchaeota archaeon]|jgi:hypothetical protein|nr:hypothetical protein [Euryarchaeota archaeon]